LLKNNIELTNSSERVATRRDCSPIEKHDVGDQSDAGKNADDPGQVIKPRAFFGLSAMTRTKLICQF
jgi:hypothetical protein